MWRHRLFGTLAGPNAGPVSHPAQQPDLPERPAAVQWHLVELSACCEQGGFIRRRIKRASPDVVSDVEVRKGNPHRATSPRKGKHLAQPTGRASALLDVRADSGRAQFASRVEQRSSVEDRPRCHMHRQTCRRTWGHPRSTYRGLVALRLQRSSQAGVLGECRGRQPPGHSDGGHGS